MPDSKFSDAPLAATLTGAENIPMSQSGGKVHSTPAQIKAYVGAPSGSGTSTGNNTGDQTNVPGTSANVTGVVLVSNGGTGATTLTGYVKGAGTTALTASATVPNADVAGLGTLATQSGTFSGTHSGASSGANTGDQVIVLTGDVFGSGAGTFAATISANSVTNAKHSTAPANTLKGNNTGSVANITDLTTAQVKTLLAIANTDVSGLGTASTLASDTDGTLSANSDTRIATQKAVKTYADQIIAAADVMVFKGVIDASANPNYPAADAGWTYRISVAGKIGGASGTVVEIGDLILCLTDATASGTQAAVGASWNVTQANIDGAVVGPASAVDSRVAMFNGASGKLIKDSGVTLSGSNTGDQTITLTGEATGSGIGSFAATLTNSAVIGKVLTGYASGAGTVTASDSILSGIQKNAGNDALRITRTGDTMTGSLNWASTVTLASAASVAIGAAASNQTIISGTTTITSFDTIAAGAERTVVFSGVLTLTHNAISLILPSAANITTAVDDAARFVSLGAGNWRCILYQKASGIAVTGSAVTLTGEAIGSGTGSFATTLTNSAVIAKVLTGYTSGAGTVSATDTILAAIQKLNGNDATNANLTGEATSVGNATTLTNSAVIAKVLTGYTAGAGTVTASDSILSAIQKNAGNDALKAPLASPTFSAGITVTSDAAINGLTVGRGPGNISTNTNCGNSAGGSNSTGITNSNFGTTAGFSNVSGNDNANFGRQAGYFGTGSRNINFGVNAGLNATSSDNTNIGFSAGSDLTTGGGNTVIGANVAAGGTAITNNIVFGNGTGAEKARHNNSGWIFTGTIATPAAAPTIASATTIAPTVAITFISGTTAIATITAPSPISLGGGTITLIPTGLWTTTTAGNIALASTAVVSKKLDLTYDVTTAKWYPSY